MAARFPKGNQVQLRPRKGHDMTWSCDKHGEPIAFYCKKHGLSVCDRCAIKEHCQKPCELDDIEDVIFERRKKLDEKRPKIQELQKQMIALDSKIKTALAFSDTNLQTINNNIQAWYHDKIKSVKEKEDRMIRVINEEADEEIRQVNEKREKRIKDCNIEREKERKIIRDEEEKLLSDAKKITEIVSKKIKDLTNKSQHVINTIKNIECTITRINQRDETLVNEAPQVLASIDENLSLNVQQDVTDCLHQIENAIQGVTFVEGEVGGKNYGRIDGYIGKWEIVKYIHIPSVVTNPWACGLVSEDEICVLDKDNNDMYITNINTQHTEEVIDERVHVTSCAPIDGNIIVCGKERDDCTGDRLDGCITLYDRQWKVIRDISIPWNGYDSVYMYVDVDMDGMIIAGDSGQSNIYIINPADDKIVNTITMQGKIVWNGIQALSSGDIIVETDYGVYTVISRSGEEKAVIHCDEWCESQCRVDKLTDTLYIVYWDRMRNTHAVDQVSRDGIIQARRIVEYKESDCPHYMSPCLVTPSGNLVVCDGDRLYLYKKTILL